MKDQESTIEIDRLTGSLSAPPPTTYRSMIGSPKKKLGAAAMKAFGGVKRILQHEITLPPAAEQLMGGYTFRPKARNRAQQQIMDLKRAVKKSHEVIASAQNFALFADRVVLDRTKITIIKRSFFWSADVISIQVEDVLNVSSSVGPIFGCITIASRVMNTTDHFEINTLWRRDAIELKHVIQGYVIAKHTGINTDSLPRSQLLETLRELGHDTGV
jgi:hypothetical protein